MAMPPAALQTVSDIARHEAGLNLGAGKAAMVEARLRRRLRALGLADYAAYCALVEGSTEESRRERRALVNAMTTNVTSLFRERHHFPILADHVARRLRDGSRREVAIWSAGGSNGCEAVSALLAIAAAVPSADLARLSVLVTDIDDGAVAAAEEGLYDFAGLTDDDRALYGGFLRRHGDSRFSLVPELRDRITVRRHNLVRTRAPGTAFDAVLCRNVLIYFDDATTRQVEGALVAAVRPGGLLFLGHSERVLPEAAGADELIRVGTTAFQRELSGRRIACQ